MLDKVFMATVALLDVFWQAPPPVPSGQLSPGQSRDPRAAFAAAALCTLGDVQFCRVKSTSYAALLQALLPAVSSSPQVG